MEERQRKGRGWKNETGRVAGRDGGWKGDREKVRGWKSETGTVAGRDREGRRV